MKKPKYKIGQKFRHKTEGFDMEILAYRLYVGRHYYYFEEFVNGDPDHLREWWQLESVMDELFTKIEDGTKI